MAKTIDWYYHRAGWNSCGKSQGFLADKGITAKETVTAAQAKFGGAEALELARSVGKVIVSKGTSVDTFDMKDGAPEDADLLKVMLGPTGNLHAPTIRQGQTLLVGFNEEVYAKTLG